MSLRAGAIRRAVVDVLSAGGRVAMPTPPAVTLKPGEFAVTASSSESDGEEVLGPQGVIVSLLVHVTRPATADAADKIDADLDAAHELITADPSLRGTVQDVAFASHEIEAIEDGGLVGTLTYNVRYELRR